MARYLLIFLFCPLAFATNYTVKTPSGGNFTTIQACANVMVPGDTCTVYAGTYTENVTVTAGAAGNYKTITVNGSDVVFVRSFTLNSHVKIVGNCPISSAYGSCGFAVGNTSSPTGTCFTAGAGVTDFYVVGNTMEACVFVSTSKTASFGYFQKNTMAYSCSTPAAPNVCTAAHVYGSHYLWENNDISHVSDGPYLYADHVVYRKNKFHDTYSTDCGSQSGNCHIDFMQADANANGGDTPAQFMLFEKNSTSTMIGSDMHAIGLFQGEVCGGECHNAIIRFHQAWNCPGCAGIVADNSEAGCPAWDHIKSYNNDWVDTGGGSGNIIHNVSYCTTNTAFVNEIYYWPSAVSNTNWYSTVGGGGSSTVPFTVGTNLAFCSSCTAANVHAHVYGSGSWTDDAANIFTNPLFNNYSGNDFSLTSGSPARNVGKALTTVNGAVSSSTTLVVADADYFQDGYGLAGVVGDCIAVGTITNTTCIAAVNYSTNTLTLSAPISAANGASVWIYSISDSTTVLVDTTGPDLGAIPFAPSGPVPPTVTTTVATAITSTTATAGGNVTSTGGASITDEGTCVGLSANPTTGCTHDGTATPFTSSLTGLTPGTLYHYRAFAINSAGTSYGADLTFTTLALPTVTTTTATSITTTGATAGGTVTSTGGAPISDEGTCVGLTANPTTGCTHDGTATPFISLLTGLTPGTLYHYRAYAKNSVGTSYGSDLTFTTSTAVSLPTVTTTTATAITSSGATAGGIVTATGGASITDEGTCVGLTANPTTGCTHDGTATPFTSVLTGLAASTLYHYRAYAVNSAGTAYGADQTFTTLPNPPTVTTTTATSITTTSAQAGGTVTATGGSAITDEGTCVGLSANPTTGCTHDGTATPFTSSLTGLSSSTLYHYRAFATNIAGTSYGADKTFTTLTPSVCSNPVLTPTAPASATGLEVVSVFSSCSTISYCTDTTNTCTPSTTYGIGIPLGSTSYVRANAAQSGFTPSGTVSGHYTVTPPTVALPLNWVNTLEWIGTTTNTITLPASGSGGAWSCGGTNYGPYTAGPGMCQQAVTDAESCRAVNRSGSEIIVPARFSCSGSGQAVTFPQTLGDSSNNFIVLISATPPAAGQTLCSHGMQDNVPASAQPGIRNLGCNGSSLSYQLGTTVTQISPGAFTLANGTVTNTSAYNDLASLFSLSCTAASCNAVKTAPADSAGNGPHHFAIIGAEIFPAPGLATPNAPVAIGLQTETAFSQFPHHIHLSEDYVHADCTDAPVSGGIATGPPTCGNSLPNGISFKACIYCSVSYSYLDRMLRPGAEGHGIYLGYWNQIKTVHNWVEGESIGLFSGGFASTVSVTGFGNDLEDRANRYTYPYSWILANAAGFCVNGLSCSGNGYVRKNSHEFKNGNRVLEDGNIYENVDNSGAQNGIIESWKANNCSNGFCDNYWLSMENVTRTNGVSRNSCQGMSWGFRSATDSNNGGGVTLPTEIAGFQNNLTYNVDLNNPGCSTASPEEGFRVNQAGTGNTWAASAVRDAAGATTTLTLTSIPGGVQSDFNVGDPVLVSGCTDTSFNTNPAAMGPLALPGTSPTGLTVIYNNNGTANASTTGCTVSNLQGYPYDLIHNHNSEFVNTTSASSPYSTADNGSSAFQLGRNLGFTNDVFVGGGINCGWGEGTRCQTKAFDPSTEIVNNDVFPGRDSLATCPGHTSPAPGGIAACYTEYSNASVPSTPATIYGVPAPNCALNNPQTGNCIGILGAMSQGSFPTTKNDWHDYRFCHAGDAACNNLPSFYSAGQSFQASDGTDQGFAPAAIDAAETSILYTCGSACGTGPYPDISALTLFVSVTGLGSVSSAPIGINGCTSTGGTCSGNFSAGSIIVLTASPGAGYQFSSWGGACSGSALTCTVTLNASQTVTATFTVIPPSPTGTVNGRPFGVMLN